MIGLNTPETPADALLPSLRLDGRLALVTGGGAGIGRATCRVLAAAGAHVLATDIDETAAQLTAEIVRDEGGAAEHLKLDVTNPEQVENAAAASRDHGVVQILINNAGIVTMAPFAELTEDEWDAVVAVSLRGTYLMTRQFLPPMKKSEWGRIISLSSMIAKSPTPYTPHYAAAKAGVIAFTQSVAGEAAPHVTVNCLCPTNIVTDIMQHDFDYFSERHGIGADELIQQWVDDIPMGRLGQPLDVARAILVLAGEAGAFTTGQAINVSGGQQIH